MTTYTIESENSTDHWPYFNTENHNVLDLGCGRWYTEKFEELSPIYFAKTANKVVGVDGNGDDILFYINETKDDPKYIFKNEYISSIDQVKKLINEHSITALKCDIEGAEVILLDLTKEDLNNVTELAMEFHSEDLKQAYLNKVIEWGFDVKVKANFARTPDYMGVLFCSKS
jgi:SAM-dependent methyltransferase